MFSFTDLGDRFCDLKKFTDALCAYGQALSCKPSEDYNSDCLAHFIQGMTKVIETKTQSAMLSQMRSANKNSENDISDSDTMAEKTNWKYYNAKAGDPCADPFSCPSCSGVLYEPVSLPCGHTFCRTHVMSNTANPSLCLKVRFVYNLLCHLFSISNLFTFSRFVRKTNFSKIYFLYSAKLPGEERSLV